MIDMRWNRYEVSLASLVWTQIRRPSSEIKIRVVKLKTPKYYYDYFWPSVDMFPREFKNWDIQNWVQIYQSMQSGVGKLSCNKTALKRCTSTETLLLLLLFDPGTQFQGKEKNTLCNTNKYTKQAGMNLTPSPPPPQNSHVVRWHCTAESERRVAEIKSWFLCRRPTDQPVSYTHLTLPTTPYV